MDLGLQIPPKIEQILRSGAEARGFPIYAYDDRRVDCSDEREIETGVGGMPLGSGRPLISDQAEDVMAKKTLRAGKGRSTANVGPKVSPSAPAAPKLSPQMMAIVAADAAASAKAPPALAVVRPGPKPPSPHQVKRLALRTRVFGEESEKRVWHKKEAAFCTIPRALPLLCTLIRHLRAGAEAERVYLDLWARQYEDGFIEVYDEEEFAMASDYAEASGVRYWRRGISELVRLGFIEVKPMNKRKFGYVLLLHPDDVVHKVYDSPKTTAPAWWLPMYEQLLERQGAKPRSRPKPSPSPDPA